MYPICYGAGAKFGLAPLWVDRAAASVHFWDPMMNRQVSTAPRVLDSAAMLRAGAMFMITTITMTTRMRGAIG